MNSNAFDGTVYALLEKAPDETIKYLLDIQENAATKLTHDGRNYLMWAAYAGKVEIMKDLIKRGSDINMVDDHGYSALAFSASNGQLNQQVYDVLLKNGANADATNRNGANALLLIAQHLEKDFSLIEYFKSKGLKITSTDNNGNGLFNYAAIKGNKALMQKAIEWKLPYKEKNLNGGNAMIFASRGSRRSTNTLEVYQFLVDLGIEANIVTKDGQTPLHNLANRTKDLAIYDFFIKKGVSVDQADKSGNTLLLNAIRRGNEEVALHFISKIADINHQNKDGYSALTYAIRGNKPAIIKALKKAGADATIVDKKGNNLVGHLFEAYRDDNQASFESSLKMLKGQKVDLVANQAKKNTLLHIAVDRNSSFLVEQAFALGIDPNAKNDDGLAPLHLAAMKAKDAKMLKLLVEKGADKNVKTDFEETVYDLASENELLKKTGFNPEELKK